MDSTTYGLPPKGLISAAEMLPYLPIKRSTLWKWVAQKKFPAPVKIGRLTRWRSEDVINWLSKFSGGEND